MIGTITMNPCMDKTLTISDFTYGGMNRVTEKRADPSGKGVNISIALTQIGVPVRTLGLEYANGSEEFRDTLEQLGVCYESLVVPGTLRENNKVYDTKTKVTTELNQKGDFVSEEALKRFDKFLDSVLGELDILVITGSVPQGVEKDYYYKLIQRANERRVKCILDAEGDLMLEGLKAKPYLIKPNLYEFQMAFGLKTKEQKAILKICDQIIAQGVEIVCLSMGGDGAMIVNSREAYICKPTPIDVKSTAGAGDSLVAGMCIAMEEGRDLGTMLRYGVSVAQGSLVREGTQLCTKENFEYFREIVKVEKIR